MLTLSGRCWRGNAALFVFYVMYTRLIYILLPCFIPYWCLGPVSTFSWGFNRKLRGTYWSK